MRHHYRHGFEWYDTDLDEGTALLHRLLAAAQRDRPVPTRDRSRSGCAPRSTTISTRRARSKRSTTSRARSSRVASDTSAPDVLRELGALLGIDLTRPRRRRADRIGNGHGAGRERARRYPRRVPHACAERAS